MPAVIGDSDMGKRCRRATAELPAYQSAPGPVMASARMACRCLLDAQSRLKNQGYYCRLLDEACGAASTLLTDRVGTCQPGCDVPKYIAEAAKEYRRAAGRSY